MLDAFVTKLTCSIPRVKQIDPDFIMVTETWAHPALSDAVFAIQGYNLFRKDRPDRRGGGVTHV